MSFSECTQFAKILGSQDDFERVPTAMRVLLCFNPRRHRPFRILPRHKGGLVRPTLAVSPLIELELRGKNDRGARRETKILIYKLKVLGQPVTSEVRSSAEK